MFFLLLSLKAEGERISVVSNGHLLKTENKDYYEIWQAGMPIEMPASAFKTPPNAIGSPMAIDNSKELLGIKNEIQAVFGATKDLDIILAVFKCESGFNPKAISPTGDYGVAQINLKAHYNQIKGDTKDEKIKNLLDYQYNIQFAKQLYDKNGLYPWVCYTKDIYH